MAKRVDLTDDTIVFEALDNKITQEINTNKLLAPTRCSHILQYHGEGSDPNPDGIRTDRRTLYTAYADGGGIVFDLIDEYSSVKPLVISIRMLRIRIYRYGHSAVKRLIDLLHANELCSRLCFSVF